MFLLEVSLSGLMFLPGVSLSRGRGEGDLCPGGSLSSWVWVQGVPVSGTMFLPGGLCPGGGEGNSVQEGVSESLSRGLCPVGSLSSGVSVQGSLSSGVSVKGSLSVGSLSRGVYPGRYLSRGICPGVSVRQSPKTETPHTVNSRQYACYWNAFLLSQRLKLNHAG